MTKRAARKAPVPISARQRAVEQLTRIEVGAAYVGLVAAPMEDVPDPRAERQATEYVAGVTRWQRWLDFLLRQYYTGPYGKMEPALKQILRLGVYELLFLETPSHAAVHEAVGLAKRVVRPGAGRLVNGLLRRLLRERDALPAPATGDPAEDLGLRFSHPTWLVRRWLGRFGPPQTEALLGWNNTRPVYGVRVNTLKTTPEAFRGLLDAQPIEAAASRYLDDFVRIRRLQPVLRAGWVHEGRCAVQDESAGLVVRLLDPRPGETIVDGCAAPGGKALYAAARMADQGLLLAYDVHPGRLQLVRAGADAQGLTILRTEAGDLRALAQRDGHPVADRVLLDAPCSGLGVLAKRADLRWRRTEEEIDALTSLQDQLLDAAADLVRPGGLLVYSTCTIEPEENAQRVDAFLQRHPLFRRESARGFVPEALVTDDGYLATLPHRDHIDGVFGARLRRKL